MMSCTLQSVSREIDEQRQTISTGGRWSVVQLRFKEWMLGYKHDTGANALSQLRDEPSLAAAGGTSADVSVGHMHNEQQKSAFRKSESKR